MKRFQKTFRDLWEDVRFLMDRLPPDIAAVYGIPRKGMVPAVTMSVLLDIPMGMAGEPDVYYKNERVDLDSYPGKLVVIDDSTRSGKNYVNIRERMEALDLGRDIIYVCVYPEVEAIGLVDLYAEAWENTRGERVCRFEWQHPEGPCAFVESPQDYLDGVRNRLKDREKVSDFSTRGV